MVDILISLSPLKTPSRASEALFLARPFSIAQSTRESCGLTKSGDMDEKEEDKKFAQECKLRKKKMKMKQNKTSKPNLFLQTKTKQLLYAQEWKQKPKMKNEDNTKRNKKEHRAS